MASPFPSTSDVRERRGRRCPAAAHAGAVCASLRLRCGAHAGVASPNSLRALRALRSNNRDESDHEARCARRPQRCAPRRPRNRRHRAPPAALNRYLSSIQHSERSCKGAFGQAAVRLWGAEQRRARGLARSASCHLTRRICLNAAHAVRVVSYATGPRDRAAQGSRRTRRPHQRSAAACPDVPLPHRPWPTEHRERV